MLLLSYEGPNISFPSVQSLLPHLQRSGPVWLLPAKVDLPGDRQANEKPVTEAVIVNKLENILHCKVDQSHGTLQTESTTLVT